MRSAILLRSALVATVMTVSLAVPAVWTAPPTDAAPAPRDGESASTATHIDASTSTVSTVQGRSVVLRWTLTNSGEPLAGARTDVRYGGKTIPATVDAAGRGALNIRDLPVGAAAVILHYPGDATHAAATATLTVSVARQVAAIVGLSASPGAVAAGRPVTIRFMVKSDGKPLAGARVAISYRGATVWAISGADGRVTQSITGSGVGSSPVLVRYFGDASRSRASASVGITVTNPCPAVAKACVDLANNITWLQDGGRIGYGPVPITSGRPGYRTHPGTFRVYWKSLNHRSSIFNGAPMPYSIFFDGGIAFHEGSLAIPSHGCIHLSRAAAQTYWGALRTGDTVFVWGTASY